MRVNKYAMIACAFASVLLTGCYGDYEEGDYVQSTSSVDETTTTCSDEETTTTTETTSCTSECSTSTSCTSDTCIESTFMYTETLPETTTQDVIETSMYNTTTSETTTTTTTTTEYDAYETTYETTYESTNDEYNKEYVKLFTRGTYYCYGEQKNGGSGRKLIDCSVGNDIVKGSVASSYLYLNYGYNYNGNRTMVYLEVNGYPEMDGYYYVDDSNSFRNQNVIDFYYTYAKDCPFQMQGVVKVECYIVN